MIRYFVSVTLVFCTLVSSTAWAQKSGFDEATRGPFTPPPSKSINGKSIERMKADVRKSWDSIVFEMNGKPVENVVTLSTDEGDVQIEFYPDVAPGHVRSFIALAKAGFYDGLIFHRCIPGFVIQGGCPKGDGTGGPGYCVKAEFNRRKHTRGTLSMARAQPNDSGGSQFFVCVAETPFLDNKYTVFGRVTQGMDVVDKIVQKPRDGNDRPFKPVQIKKATASIKG